MKANELRDMSAAELTKKLAELKEELFNLRFQHAINQLENPVPYRNRQKRHCPREDRHAQQ